MTAVTSQFRSVDKILVMTGHTIGFFVKIFGMTFMIPDDDLVGSDPLRWKCIHNENIHIIYLANPSGDTPETDDASDAVPDVTVSLPEEQVSVAWFNPSSGAWQQDDDCNGGRRVFTAPGSGDWVLLIQRLVA